MPLLSGGIFVSPVEVQNPLILVENLSKSFDTPKGPLKVLNNLSLRVHKGEILGIYGPSGAGKTTLLRCLTFLERPSGGRIFFKGEDVLGLPESALRNLRRRIGVVFQGFNLLLSRSAVSNVALPLEIQGMARREAEKKARDLLDMVQVSHRADAYPEALSGGEKQRVAIARALVTDPEVLILDEPTSSLDENTAMAILALIRDLNREKGLTVVLVTHQVKLAGPTCHRGVYLENGGIRNALEQEV